MVKVLTKATVTATQRQTSYYTLGKKRIRIFLITVKQVTHYTEVNLLTHDFYLSNDTESHEQTSTSNQIFFIEL